MPRRATPSSTRAPAACSEGFCRYASTIRFVRIGSLNDSHQGPIGSEGGAMPSASRVIQPGATGAAGRWESGPTIMQPEMNTVARTAMLPLPARLTSPPCLSRRNGFTPVSDSTSCHYAPGDRGPKTAALPPGRPRGIGRALGCRQSGTDKEVVRMRSLVVLGLGLGLFALGPVAPAAGQSSLTDQVKEGCKKELDSYCKQVTPGEGRVLAC